MREMSRSWQRRGGLPCYMIQMEVNKKLRVKWSVLNHYIVLFKIMWDASEHQ